jgi:hypothetical protein
MSFIGLYGPIAKTAANFRWTEEESETREEKLVDELLARLESLTDVQHVPVDRTLYHAFFVDTYHVSNNMVTTERFTSYDDLLKAIRVYHAENFKRSYDPSLITPRFNELALSIMKEKQKHVIAIDDSYDYKLPMGSEMTDLDILMKNYVLNDVMTDVCLTSDWTEEFIEWPLFQAALAAASLEDVMESIVSLHEANDTCGFAIVAY